MRLHLKFKNMHRGALAAGEALFASKPWAGTPDEQQTKFERFLREASAAYEVPTPHLCIDEDLDADVDILFRRRAAAYEPNNITLNKFSVTSLFHTFRLHLQFHGRTTKQFGDAKDAQAWACSLYYTLRPIAFRKAVREGRIGGVRPDDLLTSATLAARQDQIDEVFNGIVAESYSDDEVEADEAEAAEALDDIGASTVEDIETDMGDDSLTMTRAQAAEVLGVSVSTVRNMGSDGRLTEVREGRNVLVTAQSVNAYQAAQTT